MDPRSILHWLMMKPEKLNAKEKAAELAPGDKDVCRTLKGIHQEIPGAFVMDC